MGCQIEKVQAILNNLERNKIDVSELKAQVNKKIAEKKAAIKNVYTVTPKAKPDMVKAKYKASRANKYIGYGKPGSSTALYSTQLSAQGMPVNTGKYNKSDIVFVSVNGTPSRTDYLNTIKQAVAALEAGSTVLTDSEEYLAKSAYNKGEQELAKYLLSKGYRRVTSKDNSEVAEWSKSVTDNKVVKKSTEVVAKPETSDGKVYNNPDVEYLIAQLDWAKQEIEVPASPGYKFMIQGIIERAEEGLAKTDGLPEFVKQFKKDMMEVSAKRLEVLTEYFDSITGIKTYQMKPKVEDLVNGFFTKELLTKVEAKELSQEDKMRQLISIYKDEDAPKIGGGLVEDVTGKSVYDEDAKAATMMKGTQDGTLKDMLPKVDGRTINAYEKAVNAWYGEMKRGSAIQNKLSEFTKLIETVEYSPELMEELGWSKEVDKQEVDIITPNEAFRDNVNKKIECKE